MADAPLIASLTAALEAAPGDTTLRLHLAELLLATGDREALSVSSGTVLEQGPASTRALELITQAATPPAPGRPEPLGVDWAELERDLDSAVEPMFVEGDPGGPAAESWEVERETLDPRRCRRPRPGEGTPRSRVPAPSETPSCASSTAGPAWRPPAVRPAGMRQGICRTCARGRARGGFHRSLINDVLDMSSATATQPVRDLRRGPKAAPTVLFFDELDALGRKRRQLSNNAMRTTVNQLLHELDGVGPELERLRARRDQPPMGRRRRAAAAGRFIERCWCCHRTRRPGSDLPHPSRRPARDRHRHRRLARLTDGYSGADIAHVCETAAEKAMIDTVRTSQVRMIEMRDLDAALAEVRPSVGAWFDVARNVVSFSNTDGTYDELRDYMKARKFT